MKMKNIENITLSAEDLKFLDVFTYKKAYKTKLVFLTQERNGTLVFGTSRGGRVTLSDNAFLKAVSDGLIQQETKT